MSDTERTSGIGRRRVLKGAIAVPVASAAMLALSDRPAAAHARDADMFDIRAYGPAPPNPLTPAHTSAQITQAFTSALAAIATHGGGVLYVPPGVWKVDTGLSLATQGTTLLGAGMTASTIALSATSAGDTLVKCNADRLSIERLTLQGQTPIEDVGGHHGIRVGGSHKWVRIRDVIVKDVRAYGIGLESGSYSYIEIDSVSIINCGNDGIDWKNDDTIGPVPPPNGAVQPDAHPELSGTRNFIRNVVVKDFGQAEPAQAGIDVRGRVGIQSIDLFIETSGMWGVRFREDTVDHGMDADWSTLENYYVKTVGTEDPDEIDNIDRGVRKEDSGTHAIWGTGSVVGDIF
jgi:hypothetical protein